MLRLKLKNNNSIFKTILWVILFSVAMAFLESAVVVYMRALYYPEGFAFPLKMIDSHIATTELFRELATLVMLLGVGIMAGRNSIEKFAFFIISFAIWDIFYYVFLKVLLGWPESLMTWDILFMIPLTWVGPVIAPVINSLTMILLGGIIIWFVEKNGNAKIDGLSWTLLIAGSLVIIISYTLDYTKFMLKVMTFGKLFDYRNIEKVIKYTTLYIPESFNWWIFAVGEMMHLGAIGLVYRKRKYEV